jgi:alkylated DNA repair dioxygenase AlkB
MNAVDRPARSNTPQGDLFGAPRLPGLGYVDDVVSREEERALIERMGAAELTPFQFQQWEGERLTRSFGWTYDFQTGRFAPGEPIPGWIEPLRQRAAAFAGLDPGALEQVLLIEYGVGAGIGWHKDRPVFEHVIGVSLGAPTTMRFRRRQGAKFERTAAELAPRSVYHLSGEARDEWEHSISAMDEPRWSITFRSLR